jgi:hypothetical protein
MGTLKIGWLPAGILAIAVDVVAVLVYARYRRGMGAAQAPLRGAGGQVIETGCGPMEYATHGEGSPVLVVHGIFGGFDQGLVIAGGNLGMGSTRSCPLALAICAPRFRMMLRLPDRPTHSRVC